MQFDIHFYHALSFEGKGRLLLKDSGQNTTQFQLILVGSLYHQKMEVCWL